MLVSAKEMLDKAKAGHYAVGQFNINNLEWTKSVLLTAEELRSPVILGAVSYTHLTLPTIRRWKIYDRFRYCSSYGKSYA